MNIQRVSILLLILLFISCSSKKFAFRKTYDASPVAEQNIVKEKEAGPETGAHVDEEENTVSAIPDSSDLRTETLALLSEKFPVLVNYLERKYAEPPATVTEKDPIPPPPVPTEKPREANLGKVALMMMLIAYGLLLFAIVIPAIAVITLLLGFVGFIISIVALITDQNVNAAVVALVLSLLIILGFFMLILISSGGGE